MSSDIEVTRGIETEEEIKKKGSETEIDRIRNKERSTEKERRTPYSMVLIIDGNSC